MLALVVEPCHLLRRTDFGSGQHLSTFILWRTATGGWTLIWAGLVLFKLLSRMSFENELLVLKPPFVTNLSCMEGSQLRLAVDGVTVVHVRLLLAVALLLHPLWRKCWWNHFLAFSCFMTKFASLKRSWEIKALNRLLIITIMVVFILVPVERLGLIELQSLLSGISIAHKRVREALLLWVTKSILLLVQMLMRQVTSVSSFAFWVFDAFL